MLDLYVEAKLRRNGRTLGRPSLLGELAAHGIPAITSDQKEAGRALAMRGFPYTEAERRELLDYCQTDVDVLAPLLEITVQWLRATAGSRGIGQALLRGRYTCAQARMESAGVPIDVATYEVLSTHWEPVQLAMVGDLNTRWPVYTGTKFSAGAFRSELWRRGIRDWELTDTGQLDLRQSVLRDRAKSYAPLYEVYEVRHALGGMRMNDLHVGVDGRNRCWLNLFHTKTGRNQPSSSGFVFALPAWMRSLCQARPGHVMVGLDWKAQEIAIAAILAGDARLLADLETGDPYMAFANPRRSRPTRRDEARLGGDGGPPDVQDDPARRRLRDGGADAGRPSRLHPARGDRVAASPARGVPRLLRLVGRPRRRRLLRSLHGHVLRVERRHRSRHPPERRAQLPMQATGAEMLRLACCLGTGTGLAIVALIHDAVAPRCRPPSSTRWWPWRARCDGVGVDPP